MQRVLTGLLGWMLVCSSLLAWGNSSLRLNGRFGDHMVLQRDMPLRISGHAIPRAVVELRIGDRSLGVGRADKTGHWSVDVAPQPAGGPFELLCFDHAETVLLHDVYFGDVFLVSGQSNMEWPLMKTKGGATRIAQPDGLIRELSLNRTSVSTPRMALEADEVWQVAKPQSVGDFSAIAYYFAEALRAELDSVAIGLVNATWGGSNIEGWLPASVLPASDRLRIKPATRQAWKEVQTRYPYAFAGGAIPEGETGQAIALGEKWESNGFPNLDGRMNYNRTVILSSNDLTVDSLVLALGRIDDSDRTYFNGHLVGAMEQAYNVNRRYAFAAALAQAGANTIRIEVEDTGKGGGALGASQSFFIETAQRRLPLAEGWRIVPVALTLDSLARPNKTASNLYRGMLVPMSGLEAKGIVWYQGESNANTRQQVLAYPEQLRLLVQEIRKLVASPNTPFVAVELPEFRGASTLPYAENEYWPLMRIAQRSVMALPQAGSVSTLGYGDSLDIHPREKQPVGQAIADELRVLAYEQMNAPRSPRATGLEWVGRQLTVSFDRVGPEGLATRGGGPVQGFAVQLSNGQWRTASARLVSTDRVALSLQAGEEVKAVAYAWADNPQDANLINTAGLAVSSFEFSMAE